MNELDEIHAELQRNKGRQTVVLRGMPGIGKTQIAATYAARHKDDYSAIFWFNCRNEKFLRQSFLAAAQRISEAHPLEPMGEENNPDKADGPVRKWFDRTGNTKWLIIFDNYDNPKLPANGSPHAFDIEDYTPTACHGSIIVTTTDARVELERVIEVRLLDVQDSLLILEQTSGRSNTMQGKAGQAHKFGQRC